MSRSIHVLEQERRRLTEKLTKCQAEYELAAEAVERYERDVDEVAVEIAEVELALEAVRSS